MSKLDMFAIFVLVLMAISAIGIWIYLAMLPGNIAKQRGHPQADAIKTGGWMGALFGGILWPIFFVWAYTNPGSNKASLTDGTAAGKTIDALKEENRRLAQQVQQLQTQQATVSKPDSKGATS